MDSQRMLAAMEEQEDTAADHPCIHNVRPRKLLEVAHPAEKFNQSDRKKQQRKELVLHVLGIGEDVGKRAEFFTIAAKQQIHRKKNKRHWPEVFCPSIF